MSELKFPVASKIGLNAEYFTCREEFSKIKEHKSKIILMGFYVYICVGSLKLQDAENVGKTLESRQCVL